MFLNVGKYPIENKKFVKPFKFYADPGHGWLCVPKEIIEWLGITGNVTKYSYFDENNIYLEEDCDATMFDRAIKEKGLSYSIEEIYHAGNSPVRSKKRTI